MYTYLAYFSFRRGAQSDDWHARVGGIIEAHVQVEFGANDLTFAMREHAPSEEYWNSVSTALARSPILVCILSPAFFVSPWCCAELQAFIDRENVMGLPRGSLIAAARVSQTNFPEAYADVPAADFTSDFNLLPGFWDAPPAVEFTGRLRSFSADVANRLRNAPEWMPAFQQVPEPRAPAAPAGPRISRTV